MMPIYEYECGSCGARVEVLIRNQKDVPEACGKCKGKLKKALSGFSVSMASSGPKHEPSAACAACPSRGC
ncbi:MAG: zinc ribbon domain-containing protein, partial [bacterium]